MPEPSVRYSAHRPTPSADRKPYGEPRDMRKYQYLPPALALATLLSLQAVSATAAPGMSVYPGCTAPASPSTLPLPGHHAYYVDPVHGSPTGDGSAARPWHTLSEVISKNLVYDAPARVSSHTGSTAPIQSGDTVFLMSGSHGSVTLDGVDANHSIVGYNNSDFIYVVAGPGQRPVLSQLNVLGGSKWVFHGLTLQSLNTYGTVPSFTPSGGRDYYLVNLRLGVSDIVLDADSMSSADPSTASRWTRADWRTKRASGVYLADPNSCVAMTDNALQYVGFGLAAKQGDRVLVMSNRIQYFADDAVDYGSNHMRIAYNSVLDAVEDGDSFHRDAMQGQPLTEDTVTTDVEIDHNTVIRRSNASNASPGYLQGIDAFDGVWTDVRVHDNVVVTSAFHGITFYGASSLDIENNVVVGDGGLLVNCFGLTAEQCDALPTGTAGAMAPTILVQSSKAGAAPAGVTVRGNRTTALQIDPLTRGWTAAGNTCVISGNSATGASCKVGVPFPVGSGKMMWASTPGTWADGAFVIPADPLASSAFVTYDPVGLRYDLAPKTGAR